ncbi:MAG: hypothetical protein HPY66_0394 [Firmicutes bacterium]|nr:hypothetical protein [Bacillota bacterium]
MGSAVPADPNCITEKVRGVRVLGRFSRALDKMNKAVEYIVAVMLVIMVIVIFLQVIFRFIIKSAIPWSEELARYLLVWTSFLGASIGIKRKGHIGVEAVVQVLPPGVRTIVSLIANGLSMVFFVVIIVYGYKILKVVSIQLSPAMEISMAVPYSAIFVSGLLMLLYSINSFAATLKNLKEGM